MDAKNTFGIKRHAISAAFTGLVQLVFGGGSIAAATYSARSVSAERQMTVQSKFYCNTKSLTPAERARHTQLTNKLMSIRKEVIETDNGYEFQYSPSEVSLLDLADWVVAEGKCCPFFDFHIDLEREGSLLCLRLTGEKGVKDFIRAEFNVPAK
jgi:hypothetical protein